MNYLIISKIFWFKYSIGIFDLFDMDIALIYLLEFLVEIAWQIFPFEDVIVFYIIFDLFIKTLGLCQLLFNKIKHVTSTI